jgi:hypothetical protein
MPAILILCLFLIAVAAPLRAAAPDSCTYPDISYTSQLSEDTECGGHLRPGTVGSVIQKHGYCRFLDNSSENDYFGPARTGAELVAFFTHAPTGVVVDRCIRPFSQTDTVDMDCFIAVSDVHYGDVQADNPTGCLLSGNMTSISHTALLSRWANRASLLNGFSQTPPEGSLTTFQRSDTNSDSLSERSVYTFPMQRKDCRTARTGVRVCNYRQFSQVYTYDYSVSPLPASELGYILSLILSKSNDAPPFEAPAPLDCPPEYAHDQYFEADGGTRWRAATLAECPYGIGTRQCEQRVWNHYHCDDGVADIVGSATHEDTGICTGACTPQPCNLPWGGQIASGSSVTGYYQYAPGCGSACYVETRTCNNGSLSGSYGASSCNVQECNHYWVQIEYGDTSGARPCKSAIGEMVGQLCYSPGDTCYPVAGVGGPLGKLQCQ